MPGALFKLLPLILATIGSLAAPISIQYRQAAPAPKLVVAHVIVGNTASYSVDTWQSDIQLAQANGIDGFALNIGSTAPFTDAQVQNAFDAAKNLNSDFKLFFSFDMAASTCDTVDDSVFLRKKITDFSSSPAMLKIDGKVFASTFAGESCAWGGQGRAGWTSLFTNHPDLTGQNAVYFAPAFFVNPATEFSTFGAAMQGAFNFNGGWPVNAYDGAHNAIADPIPLIADTKTDSTFLDALAALPANADGSKKIYMTAAAPWFFTHFGAPLNKNFIFNSDENMFVKRFQNLVQDTDVFGKTDILQLVTWNDFGESHYLNNPHTESDIPTGAAAWTDNFDHTPWLAMVKFLSDGFKVGSFEKPPTNDQITIWARPHPKDATATADALGLPQNAAQPTDALFATAFLTAPGDVILTTNTGKSQTFPGQVGINNFNVPLAPGDFIQGTISRAGANVVDVKPQNYGTFNPTPATINFNAFVAGASARAAPAAAPPA